MKYGDMLKRYPVKEQGDLEGYTPIQCYVLMDSHGECSGPYPCTDPDMLDKVLRGKENANCCKRYRFAQHPPSTAQLLRCCNESTSCLSNESSGETLNLVVNLLHQLSRLTHGAIPRFVRFSISCFRGAFTRRRRGTNTGK